MPNYIQQITQPQQTYTDGYGVERPVYEEKWIAPTRKIYNKLNRFFNGPKEINGYPIQQGAGILDLLNPESAANLMKAAKEAPKVVETISRAKRPRITVTPKRQAVKVNYTPKQKPVVSQEHPHEANMLMQELDAYIKEKGIDPKTYSSSVRKTVWNAANKGTYGPTGKNIQRITSKEVRSIPDYYQLGPASKAHQVDKDLKNAETMYDLWGFGHNRPAPNLSEQFLNSGLEKASELTKTKGYVKPINKPTIVKSIKSERPVTTIQPDVEKFYEAEDIVNGMVVPKYRSSYEGAETFEDMYRRLTGYRGMLLDKNGGKLNGMKKTR